MLQNQLFIKITTTTVVLVELSSEIITKYNTFLIKLIKVPFNFIISTYKHFHFGHKIFYTSMVDFVIFREVETKTRFWTLKNQDDTVFI